MKIYRVSHSQEYEINHHGGYTYFASRQRARIEQNKVNREYGTHYEFTTIEFERPSRRTIIQMLNQYGGHPDNG